jgi:hypothetical protein
LQQSTVIADTHRRKPHRSREPALDEIEFANSHGH